MNMRISVRTRTALNPWHEYWGITYEGRELGEVKMVADQLADLVDQLRADGWLSDQGDADSPGERDWCVVVDSAEP